MFHVNPEFLGTVGKLALVPVGAKPLLHVVFAQGALGFGRSAPVREGDLG
jgi:hypothetical protein